MQKKEIKESTYYELCKNICKSMILIICEFSYEILFKVSIHLFLRAKKTESIEMLPLPIAGEALPWKLNRFGPECAHVPLFTVLIVLFLSLVQGREYLFFLATHWIFNFCLLFFQCLFSVQSYVPRCSSTGNVFGRVILSFLWNCW